MCAPAVLPADLLLRQEFLRHELACVAEQLKIKSRMEEGGGGEGVEGEEAAAGGGAAGGGGEEVQAAARAVAQRVAISVAAEESALVGVAAQLTSLTHSMYSLTPAVQAALQSKLPPAMLLALSALTDRAGDVVRRGAAEAADGGPRGLLDMLDRHPVQGGAAQGGAAPQELSSLPVPTLFFPSARHEKPVRLTWAAWYQLWHEGIFASMAGAAADPFSRARKCPPLRLTLEPADLTWSRSEAHQAALSKAILLCRLINAVTEYEVAAGKSPADAVAAMAERFTTAWSKSKEYALKGARAFFKDSPDAKYTGQDLRDFYTAPKRAREEDGEAE